MKEHFLLLTCIMSFLFTGCIKEESINNIAFNIEVIEIQSYSATIIVSHNATNDDGYYGFAVKGEVSDINREIEKYVNSLDNETLQDKTFYQRKKKIAIVGLLPNSTYTYIVFGLNGQSYYGKPSAIVIHTNNYDLEAKVNPNWSIEYQGHTIYEDTDYSKFIVRVSEEIKERYFMAIFPIEKVQDNESIESIINIAFSEMQNKNDSEIWFENNQIHTASTIFYRHLQEGDYIAYAIGINETYTPSGSYIKSDIFHVDKYPYVAEYENMLGKWLLKDNNNKGYTITFSEAIINKYLIMSGWGNFSDPAIPILVSFDRNDGSITIANQLIFEKHKMTFSDGTTLEGKLYYRGTYVNEDSKHKLVNNNPIKGTLNTDGSYTVNGFVVNGEDGTKYNGGMALYLKGTENTVWYASMMFPLTIYKFGI